MMEWIEKAKKDFDVEIFRESSPDVITPPNYRCVIKLNDGYKANVEGTLEHINEQIGNHFYIDEIREQKINKIIDA